MTGHTKYALARTGIFEVLDLLLAIATTEAGGTKGLIACQDGEILNLVAARITAICTIVANK